MFNGHEDGFFVELLFRNHFVYYVHQMDAVITAYESATFVDMRDLDVDVAGAKARIENAIQITRNKIYDYLGFPAVIAIPFEISDWKNVIDSDSLNRLRAWPYYPSLVFIGRCFNRIRKALHLISDFITHTPTKFICTGSPAMTFLGWYSWKVAPVFEQWRDAVGLVNDTNKFISTYPEKSSTFWSVRYHFFRCMHRELLFANWTYITNRYEASDDDEEYRLALLLGPYRARESNWIFNPNL